MPGALDDQSRKFSRMLEAASDRDMPVFLPPGTYAVSNLNLPRHVRLSGVPGATRIVYGGDGHLFLAEQTELLHLDGLLIDGANRWIGDQAQGLIDARGVSQLVIDNCRIIGSGKNGIALERVAGRVERCEISGAADAGIFSVEGAGLQITGNTVSGCGNGGILVHRWQIADDGTIVTGNRVSRDRCARRRHRPERQWHQHLSRQRRDGFEQSHHRHAPFRRSAATAPATFRSAATPASPPARRRSMPNSLLKAR